MVVRMIDEVPRFRGLGQKFGGSASVDEMRSVVGGVGLSSLVYGPKPFRATVWACRWRSRPPANKCARALPLSAVQYTFHTGRSRILTGYIYGINNSLNDTCRTWTIECSVAYIATGIICGCENFIYAYTQRIECSECPNPAALYNPYGL